VSEIEAGGAARHELIDALANEEARLRQLE
jgi:hypothetical protein